MSKQKKLVLLDPALVKPAVVAAFAKSVGQGESFNW